jgi:hypothetical protein
VKALTDSIMARAKLARHGRVAWHERLPEATRQELEALRARWQSGEIGLQKRPFARAIISELEARNIHVAGVQGVEDWLDKTN